VAPAPAPVAHVFVYGTLKRGEANHARHAGDALEARPAWIPGRIHHLAAGYPAYVPGETGRVRGEALRFPDLAAALRRLDRLEGAEYRREVRTVHPLDGGAPFAAHVYVFAGPLPEGAVLVADGDWSARRRPAP